MESFTHFYLESSVQYKTWKMKASGVAFFPCKVHFLWPWPLSFSSLPPSLILILPHCLGSQLHSNSGVEEMIPLPQAWHHPSLVFEMKGSVPLPTCSWISLSSETQDPSIYFTSSSWDWLNYSLSWKVTFLRNGIFAAISVKKKKERMSQSSEIAVTTDGKLVSREETHEGKSICHLAVIRLHPLPTVSPEETQHVKIESWPPDSWDTYQRNDFSEPRALHLPTYWKVLNSLTWDIDFL